MSKFDWGIIILMVFLVIGINVVLQVKLHQEPTAQTTAQ